MPNVQLTGALAGLLAPIFLITALLTLIVHVFFALAVYADATDRAANRRRCCKRSHPREAGSVRRPWASASTGSRPARASPGVIVRIQGNAGQDALTT